MKYKYNGQWYDIAVKALDSMEIGCIIQFMGNTIPNGWLECDGSSITQSDYPELYALIGGTLPNFKGRVLVGQDTSDTDFDTLGETGGSKNTRMSDFGDGLRNGDNGTDWVCQGINVTRYVSHLQPYAVVKHIIKAKNTTPTMASIVNSYSNSTTNGYSCDYINDLSDTRGTTKKLADVSNQEITITLVDDSLTNYKYILSVSGYGYHRSCTMLPMSIFRSLNSNFKQLNQYVKTYNSNAYTSVSYISDTQFKIYGAVGTDTTTQVWGIK